jgi:hypothetical protein
VLVNLLVAVVGQLTDAQLFELAEAAADQRDNLRAPTPTPAFDPRTPTP